MSEESKLSADPEADQLAQRATAAGVDVSSRERAVREIQLRFAPLVLRLRPEDEPGVVFSCR